MKKLYPLFGIVSVLNTPFTSDNRLDLAGLKRNVELAIEAGVAGFLVPAMASEVYKLSRIERSSMVETVLATVSGRVPVIGGAGDLDRNRRLQIVRDLLSIGCREVLLQIPFTNRNQFDRDVKEIAEMDVNMIMIQDWDATGYGLETALICKLFEEVDQFRCLKIEVIPAGSKYSEVLKATEGKLNISGGWAVTQMLEALERGIHAFMPTGMHEIYTTIYSIYKSGHKNKAQKLFYELLPVLAFSNQHLDISIHFFKRLLKQQRIYATAKVREPILPFDEIHKKIADQLIDHVIYLIWKINTQKK
jgi:4-hydroxy-tetrahydrodipicolinate synthase